MPTGKDIMMSRVTTTGISETTFLRNNTVLRISDVGGRRSERKQWIRCFENVNAVIFTIDLASYDLILFEDESVNRLQEDLRLFDSIINSHWFAKTNFALVFTKMDKLALKIKRVSLPKYFPDYEGGDDIDAAKDYLTKRFLSLDMHGKDVQVSYVTIDDDLGVASTRKILDDLVELNRRQVSVT
jgi:guanine nucleotide-binding protein G(i) subunit alpha